LAHTFDLNRKTHPSVKLHALHPPAPAASDKGQSAAGFLLRRYRSARRFSEGSLLRRLQPSAAVLSSYGRGMLVVSVARRLGSEGRLLAYCAAPLQPSGPQKGALGPLS
jgi:hypothetical protein